MKRILTLIFILFVCLSGKAQEVEISGSRKAVRTSGDVLAFVTPVASLTTVLVLQDWKGLKQGALAGVSTIGMTYALKYLIKKERPDGSDKHSFLPCTPQFHLRELHSSNGAMAGNGEFRPMRLPRMSDGAGRMPKSTTGGTLWREPLSEPEALTFLPVRLPRSITCLSALLRVINTSAYMLP